MFYSLALAKGSCIQQFPYFTATTKMPLWVRLCVSVLVLQIRADIKRLRWSLGLPPGLDTLVNCVLVQHNQTEDGVLEIVSLEPYVALVCTEQIGALPLDIIYFLQVPLGNNR